MTREEAIYTLRGLFIPCASDGNKWGCDRNEALDMAIEALHREEAEEKGYCHRIRPSNVEVVVRCKDCRWYRDTFFDTKITPTCDRHIDDRYGTLVGGITGNSFCSYGERKKP